MIKTKDQFSHIFIKNLLSILFYIVLTLSTFIKQSYALSHEWVGVPKSEYGEQLWDRKSIKRNGDGSVRVLSKFIPKTKSEITKDILYTMEINCFEKSFRDVGVSVEDINNDLNNFVDWKNPDGDQLIMGVIGQVCSAEK